MFRRAFILALIALAADGATLQQLSLDQMSQLATSVVRARITGISTGTQTNSGSSIIYTSYSISVSEIWKGAAAIGFVLPGGTASGQKQSFPGVPELRIGDEYVLFLWKSPTTGLVHSLGLTQGIFGVTSQADGSVMASRAQIGELMLDASGQRVTDHAITMNLKDMRSHVRAGVTK
jgi:hypothetical protein